MTHEVAGVARCNFCDRTFAGPAAIVIGQGSHGRLESFLTKIVDHLRTAHPDEYGYIEMKVAEFAGMMRLRQYSVSDGEVQGQMDYLRWSILQATIANRISDESMQRNAQRFADELVDDCVAELVVGGSPARISEATARLKRVIGAKLTELLKGMQIELHETGKYVLNPETTAVNGQKVAH